MMKRVKIYIAVSWILACMGFSACSVASRLTRSGAAAELSHANKSLKLQAQATPAPPKKTIRKEEKKPDQSLIPMKVITENGEQMLLMEMQEVVVTTTSRTLAERDGRVDIDFLITLPEQLQGACRSIVVTPVLHRNSQSLPLQEIVIRGAFFDKVIHRDYWQYFRYLKVFSPDSSRAANAFKRFVRFPLPQDVRRDSITDKNRDLSYHYTQQVPTASAGKTLKITLEGRVQGLDGTSYSLPPSDTLQYHISSMLFFVDETPRYLSTVIKKYAEVRNRNSLSFRTADTRIIDTLKGNGAQLTVIAESMNNIVNSPEFSIDSIILCASSSPEGSRERNVALSHARAMALRNYLIEQFPAAGLDSLITVRSLGEDWATLASLLSKDRNVTHATQILALIESQKDEDRREEAIRRLYADDYAYIRKEYYPRLRTVEFHYYMHRTDMTQDTIVTTEVDSIYLNGVELLKQRRYQEAYAVLLPYADVNTAVCLLSLSRNAESLDLLRSLDNSAPVYYLRAIAYARLGREAEALDAYHSACAEDENMEYRAALDPELNRIIKNRNNEEVE